MIEPRKSDIGRTVAYSNRDHLGGVPEQGILTAFNDLYAFVRYGNDHHAKATRFEDLEWVTPVKTRRAKR